MSGSGAMLRVTGLAKKYCRSLRQAARYAVGDLLRGVIGRGPAAGDGLRMGEFWALQEVHFELNRGDCLGVIGANGSGKSTLLKLIGGIVEPDRGRIEVRGRVGCLIELGAGFHPQLSGRENIYINAALLGLSRRETYRRFDEIVEFAELAEFIDTPVKFYSSGMYVRLGFAVAAHLEPDILLVDEVLSVGDLAFQARCLDRMEALRQAGTTFLFVSHDVSKVGRLCSHTLVLSHGKVVFLGETMQAIDRYRELSFREAAGVRTHVFASPELEITGVEFLDESAAPLSKFTVGAPLRIRVHYRAHRQVEEAPLNVGIFRCDDLVQCSGFRSDVDGCSLGPLEAGIGFRDLVIPACHLMPGQYTVSVILWKPGGLAPYAWNLHGHRFTVAGGAAVSGICYLPHVWEKGHHMPDGK